MYIISEIGFAYTNTIITNKIQIKILQSKIFQLNCKVFFTSNISSIFLISAFDFLRFLRIGL